MTSLASKNDNDIYLLSTGSTNYFPTNTLNSFSNHLHSPIHFPPSEQWGVAVTQLGIHPRVPNLNVKKTDPLFFICTLGQYFNSANWDELKQGMDPVEDFAYLKQVRHHSPIQLAHEISRHTKTGRWKSISITFKAVPFMPWQEYTLSWHGGRGSLPLMFFHPAVYAAMELDSASYGQFKSVHNNFPIFINDVKYSPGILILNSVDNPNYTIQGLVRTVPDVIPQLIHVQCKNILTYQSGEGYTKIIGTTLFPQLNVEKRKKEVNNTFSTILRKKYSIH